MRSRKVPNLTSLLTIAFLILAGTLLGLAVWHGARERAELDARAADRLAEINSFKASQLAAWRIERLRGLGLQAQQPVLGAIRRLAESPRDRSAFAATSSWLKALCAEGDFPAAVLAGGEGDVLAQTGEPAGDKNELAEAAREVLAAGQPLLRDFRTGPARDRAALGLNVPLRLEPGRPPFAALLLTIDSRKSIEPLLRFPSAAGGVGSVLARRDPDGSVSVIEPDRAILRLPAGPSDLALARAVLAGDGVVRGKDRTGANVIAAIHPVAGYPWSLVSIRKPDVAAGLQDNLIGILVVLPSLLLAAWMGFLWRQGQLRFLRAKREAVLERAALVSHYDYLRRFANDIVLLLDEHTRIIEVNDRAMEAYGYSREELTGMSAIDLRSLAARSQWPDHWPASIVFETEHRRKDGSVFPVEISSRAIEVEGKRYRQSIIRDITQRKQDEEALKQSEERYRRLIEGAPLGVYVETDNTFRYLNSYAIEQFGASSSEALVGTCVMERLHPNYHAVIAERINRLKERAEPTPPLEEEFLTMDGRPFWVEASGVPFQYEGKPGALVFFKDIGKRKRIEEERSKLEQQFLQAQKMESIGRLAGGIAHDFNNLLTVINGYAQVLAKKLDPRDPLQGGLGEIQGAAQRAITVTRQLLTISRRQVLESVVVDMNKVVGEMRGLLERLLGENVLFAADLADGLRRVKVDPAQMQQVILNLAVNARDAMPQGGCIRIGTSNVQDTGEVCLSVSDNGCGMDTETLNRIFDPFFTTKPAGQGTGLGLSTTYGIVRQSNGRITVESEPGKGTTFRVYLPQVDEPDAASPSEATAGHHTVAPADLRGKETILVVEDQEHVRKLTAEVLRSHGYRVVAAACGEEALEIARASENRIDLLLTDLVMPGLHGGTLAVRMRQVQPQARVLLMTAYPDDSVVLPERREDWHWIAKPFAPTELAERVRNILGAPAKAVHVLVVDDHEVIRKVVRLMLETSGFQVSLAADGNEALSAIRRDRPAVVLTDISMPNKEGLEMIRELRKENNEVKIVVMSGAFGGQYPHAAQLLGADAALPKPLDPETLTRTIRGLMERKPVSGDVLERGA